MSNGNLSVKKIDLSLMELVGSLSPTEKQFFKRKYGNEADFVRIFDLISESKSCSSDLIRKRLDQKKNGKKWTSGHLSSLKAYLKERILESLRHQHLSKSPSFEILAACVNTDILIDKGLYHQAKTEIRKKYGQFNDQSWPIERLQLLRRSSILQFYENYEYSTYEEILDLYAERQNLAEQMLLEIKYARILTVLGYQYFKGIKDEKLLESFMNEPYMKDIGMATEFETKYLFHWVHAQFHEMNDQPELAIEHFQNAMQEWLNHPSYIDAHTRMYLGGCFTYLKHLLQLENPYRNILSHETFDDILGRVKGAKLEQDIETQYRQLFAIGRILALRKEKEYAAIINDEQAYKRMLASAKSKTQFIEIMIYYLIALAHFNLGQFDSARNLLSDLIYSENIQLQNNPEYFSHVLMLSMLCHFELNELKYLRTLRTQYTKVLNKHNRYGDLEKFMFQMLSQMSSERYKHHRHAVLERFDKRIDQTIKKKDLDEHPDYKFYLDWIRLRHKTMPRLFLQKT